MKKILIFSANDLFSHVLALELTKIGGIAERFEIKHNLKNPPQGYDLYVVDTALGGSRELAQSITRFEESSLILLSKSDYDDWQDFAESPRCVRLRRPFLMKDLRERAMQLLKSNSTPRSGIDLSPSLQNQDPAAKIRIDKETQTIYYRDVEVSLTKKEFDLFCYLYVNRNQALSRDKIFRDVWGYSYMGEGNIVDVYVRYLRTKIDDRFGIKLIYTVRGIGYSIK